MTRDKTGIRYTLRDSAGGLIFKIERGPRAWARGLKMIREYVVADENDRPDLWRERLRVNWQDWRRETYFSWQPLEGTTEGAFCEWGARHHLHAVYIGTPLRRIDPQDAPSSLVELATGSERLSDYHEFLEKEEKKAYYVV